MTTPQLPLALRFPAHQRFDAYVPGENAATVAAVQRVAHEPGAPWVFLAGPEGSGKSHLLIAACRDAGERRTQYLPLARLGESAEAALLGLEDFDLLAVDGIEAITGQRAVEIALFDVYNRGRARGAAMLFAARLTPPRLALVLPDLASRLASCTQCVLKPLDEAARRTVLRERAQARGFELDESVLDFLFRRYPRDLGAMLELLARVDRESLAAQRRITVPFLRRIIGLPSRDPSA